jgi:hypothetical protein
LAAGESPTKEHITAFFRRFKAVLDARGLTVRGITTDGSQLYPEPIAAVFGVVEHQVCEFHVLQEITRAVLHAVAKIRKALVARMPALGRGRPTGENTRLARQRKRLTEKSAKLFEHRHLFVKHHLTDSERQTLQRITRGQKQLRALRQIMDEVYRLFDRRCRTETALRKLARLRTRVGRFRKLSRTLQKLWSPNLEKALTFLDDRLLPPTSNAVERGNRRHRKMQKTVYRVRTQQNLSGRIRLDLLRDARANARSKTTRLLHVARNTTRAAQPPPRRRRKAA